ncbi:MAG: type II secretion system protein GspK [Verrucomicrobiae bacterium]|nr:type II secretion system protein GspK [Verrucomicrobiae bacterium]
MLPFRQPIASCSRLRGAALLIVLWTMLALGMVVIGFVKLTQNNINGLHQLRLEDRARQLAESGIVMALHPQVAPGDPVLNQEFQKDESFSARIVGESGRLQINYILKNNQRDVLVNLFLLWGLSRIQADTVADCLLDWVNPGAGRRLNGAIAEHYRAAGLPYVPTGKEFESLDEMTLVMNFSILSQLQPRWRDCFTIWTDGRLDFNSAPPDNIAAATGISLAKARELADYRNGADGLSGTADDHPFENLDSVRVFLGLNSAAFAAVQPPPCLESPIIRAESVGNAHGRRLTLQVVARREADLPVFMEWNEL